MMTFFPPDAEEHVLEGAFSRKLDEKRSPYPLDYPLELLIVIHKPQKWCRQRLGVNTRLDSRAYQRRHGMKAASWKLVRSTEVETADEESKTTYIYPVVLL
jgi:hypothetical protein